MSYRIRSTNGRFEAAFDDAIPPEKARQLIEDHAAMYERHFGKLERQKRVKYYQRHLYEFCTEILGYDKLSPTFHGPLLKMYERHFGKVETPEEEFERVTGEALG